MIKAFGVAPLPFISIQKREIGHLSEMNIGFVLNDETNRPLRQNHRDVESEDMIKKEQQTSTQSLNRVPAISPLSSMALKATAY
jgi:hypothetical protein